MMRLLPPIDWTNVAIWTGLAVLTVIIWSLAIIGAGTVLGWVR